MSSRRYVRPQPPTYFRRPSAALIQAHRTHLWLDSRPLSSPPLSSYQCLAGTESTTLRTENSVPFIERLTKLFAFTEGFTEGIREAGRIACSYATGYSGSRVPARTRMSVFRRTSTQKCPAGHTRPCAVALLASHPRQSVRTAVPWNASRRAVRYFVRRGVAKRPMPRAG